VETRPSQVQGRRVEAVGRWGEFRVLDPGGPRVLVHLAQGGRVGVEAPRAAVLEPLAAVAGPG
jgi:hypothetical protein